MDCLAVLPALLRLLISLLLLVAVRVVEVDSVQAAVVVARAVTELVHNTAP
jgi:hypothetical protein